MFGPDFAGNIEDRFVGDGINIVQHYQDVILPIVTAARISPGRKRIDLCFRELFAHASFKF